MNNNDYIDHLNNYFKSYICISKNYDFMFYTIYKNGCTKVNNELKDYTYIFNKATKHRNGLKKENIDNNNNNNIILDNLKKHNIKNIFYHVII